MNAPCNTPIICSHSISVRLSRKLAVLTMLVLGVVFAVSWFTIKMLIVEKNRELYHKRRDVLVDSFRRAGWDIPAPPASMFAWAPLPPALKEMGSFEFSKQLLTHADVAVAPGVGYGEDGEGFVRIALVENEQRLRQAARNVKRYLQSMGVNTSAA